MEHTPFAGLDRHSKPEMPNHYRDVTGVKAHEQPPSFIDVIQTLPRATKLQAGYFDPIADEWRPVTRNVAVVNPDWLGDGLDTAPKTDAAWNFPTNRYEPVPPMAAYGRFVALARQRALDDAPIYGDVRTYRNGGEAHLDIFFDALSTRVGGDRFVAGFSSSYDYYGGRSHRADLIALNTSTGTVLRYLHKPLSTPHVGSVGKRIAGWSDGVFEKLAVITDALTGLVADAAAYEFPLATLPVERADIYRGLGVADEACEDALAELDAYEAANPDYRHTAWAYYRALITTINARSTVKDGNSGLKARIRAANKLLYHPARVEASALEAAAKATVVDEDGRKQTRLDPTAQAELTERIESLQTATKTTRDFRSRVRDILADLEAEPSPDEKLNQQAAGANV